jgi:hypothetical protein
MVQSGRLRIPGVSDRPCTANEGPGVQKRPEGRPDLALVIAPGRRHAIFFNPGS